MPLPRIPSQPTSYTKFAKCSKVHYVELEKAPRKKPVEQRQQSKEWKGPAHPLKTTPGLQGSDAPRITGMLIRGVSTLSKAQDAP